MRMAAIAIVGVLSAGGGLDAGASGSAIQAAQAVATVHTVLKVEGMT